MLPNNFESTEKEELILLLSKYKDVKFLDSWLDSDGKGAVEYINALYIISKNNEPYYLYVEKYVYPIGNGEHKMVGELKKELHTNTLKRLIKNMDERGFSLEFHPILQKKFEDF